MSKKQTDVNIDPFQLNPEGSSYKFFLLASDILKSEAYKRLKPAAQAFLITLLDCYHSGSRSQLEEAISQYNKYFDLGMNEQDIQTEITWGRNNDYKHFLFLAPQKILMEEYGWSKSYISKLKQELIDAGFIKIWHGGKGKKCGWGKNETVYSFSRDFWKSE